MIVRSVPALRRALESLRAKKATTALVPTMGALHDGHVSLVRLAKRRAAKVIVSIFVNPTQFAPSEDFGSYPRTWKSDVGKLAAEDVDLIWNPDVKTMYPDGFATRILTEGPAIVQYLADQNPASGLAPKAGTVERYRLQEWLNFIGTELHKSFGSLFNKASSDDAKNTAKTNINKRLTYLNDQLANRQYLMGSNFTVADAYAFTIVNWTNFVGIDLKAYPNVAAYQARVGGRPKVHETLKAEGLAK